ncbi:MAG: tetratricopeptide repeat protein [Gammaproteobacteria bacterium]|nr:tetratricopeptide repeat protein [Gammaproteobacteria bacterium]
MSLIFQALRRLEGQSQAEEIPFQGLAGPAQTVAPAFPLRTALWWLLALVLAAVVAQQAIQMDLPARLVSAFSDAGSGPAQVPARVDARPTLKAVVIPTGRRPAPQPATEPIRQPIAATPAPELRESAGPAAVMITTTREPALPAEESAPAERTARETPRQPPQVVAVETRSRLVPAPIETASPVTAPEPAAMAHVQVASPRPQETVAARETPRQPPQVVAVETRSRLAAAPIETASPVTAPEPAAMARVQVASPRPQETVAASAVAKVPAPTTKKTRPEQAAVVSRRARAQESSEQRQQISRLTAALTRAVQAKDEIATPLLLEELAAAAGPDSNYLLNMRAFVAMAHERYDEVETLLVRVLARDENNLNASLNLAVAESRTGRVEQARERLENLALAYPHDDRIPRLMGSLRQR